MAIPAAAAIATALPYILKLPKYAKRLYGSKNFLPALIGAGYLGSEALGAVEQAGERGLTKEQLRLQNLISKASAEATKMSVEESRKNTEKYIKALMKAKREESKENRDLAALQSFTQSQDRQMALVIQAMQAMTNKQMGASTSAPGGGGMLGLMRGGM
jgi:hypothetical protein